MDWNANPLGVLRAPNIHCVGQSFPAELGPYSRVRIHKVQANVENGILPGVALLHPFSVPPCVSRGRIDNASPARTKRPLYRRLRHTNKGAPSFTLQQLRPAARFAVVLCSENGGPTLSRLLRSLQP